VIAAVPAVVGVNVTEQLPEARVQVLEENEPDTPACVNVTVPVGVVTAPGEVSETVAVHVVETPVKTVVGEHVTAVEVARGLTVTLAAALVLPLWVESPP
jgi:hypothetical protein